MQFKDVKQNYPVFILNKQEFSITQGKVVGTTFPRIDINSPVNNPMNYAKPGQMVVDITIEANGKTATYTIPENLSVTYAGDLVLSTDEQGLANEVEAMMNTAKQYFAAEGYQKKVLKNGPGLLADLNPEYKSKIETEERFTKLENSVGEMKTMLTNFIKEFKS